ncbi:hypothetical protein MJG53_006625 [Ovis ammon polii x Ovis aries]|uniref:Uncharacterized protein n=1 Tax=Ovis ammon polii x Ovis aries TaxID=2918886 RepID=A0ACB9V599_9CETA|nr:hypothetical protein MJG53_006625 [Ovis ammon polii x Ovis aries]
MGEGKSKVTELNNPIAEERRRDVGSFFSCTGFSHIAGNFSYGPVVKNPPCKSRDIDSIIVPGLQRGTLAYPRHGGLESGTQVSFFSRFYRFPFDPVPFSNTNHSYLFLELFPFTQTHFGVNMLHKIRKIGTALLGECNSLIKPQDYNSQKAISSGTQNMKARKVPAPTTPDREYNSHYTQGLRKPCQIPPVVIASGSALTNPRAPALGRRAVRIFDQLESSVVVSRDRRRRELRTGAFSLPFGVVALLPLCKTGVWARPRTCVPVGLVVPVGPC